MNLCLPPAIMFATGNRFVGSMHAKTCVILALRDDKKVVLAHIDAMCINSVEDMTKRRFYILSNFVSIYIAHICVKLRLFIKCEKTSDR